MLTRAIFKILDEILRERSSSLELRLTNSIFLHKKDALGNEALRVNVNF